jgi:hypothetical protein
MFQMTPNLSPSSKAIALYKFGLVVYIQDDVQYSERKKNLEYSTRLTDDLSAEVPLDRHCPNGSNIDYHEYQTI